MSAQIQTVTFENEGNEVVDATISPDRFKVLHVGWCGSYLTVYYETNPTSPVQHRVGFHCLRAGDEIPAGCMHVGSADNTDGQAWHIYRTG